MRTTPQTIRKVFSKIIPLIVVCYFVTYLDRINLGVAAVQMNQDLGLTATAFGIGSGLFFVTYLLLEVPSNVLMHRFGARIWIPRILVTIGLVAAATALVSGPTGFYAVRLLLGAVEAGAAPAYVLYLSLWFPAAVRARAFAYYFAAIPLATIVGAPVGALLLGLDGVGGLRGWQWVFVCPAVLTVALGVASYFLFADGPADARWLTPQERTNLQHDLLNDVDTAARRGSRLAQLLRPQMLLLALIHLAGNIANYTLSFFLPQIIKSFGLTDASSAALSALPYLVGALVLLYFGWRSSRRGPTKLNLALPFLVGVVGFTIAALARDPVILVLALCMAAVGGLGYLPAFWTLPSSLYSGIALATSIAAVNSFGNLGGAFGPTLMGYFRDRTDSFSAGLGFCAVVVALGAVAGLVAGTRRRTTSHNPRATLAAEG